MHKNIARVSEASQAQAAHNKVAPAYGQGVPLAVLIGMFGDMVSSLQREISERDQRIAELEYQLRIANAAWKPVDVVLQ